jgi:hypothetical protein
MFKFILWVRLMRLIIFLKHRRAVLIYLFFGRTGVWTQVFVLSKQALYCLNHTSSLFCSAYFGGEGGGLQNYLSRLASNHTILDLSLLTSRFIGMSHQYLAAFFFFFLWLVLAFELGASCFMAGTLPLEPLHQPLFPFLWNIYSYP